MRHRALSAAWVTFTVLTAPVLAQNRVVITGFDLPYKDKIVFSTFRDGNDEVYSMNADGSEPINLTRNAGTASAAWDGQPAWSPDGSKIAFMSNRTGNTDIFVMNSDGTNPVNITNHPARDERLTWSPDSRRIAFESNRSGTGVGSNFDIYTMNLDGTAVRALAGHPAEDGRPAWSPDGRSIAFQSRRSTAGDFEIYVHEIGTTIVRNVSNRSIAVDVFPTWSPDGTRIAYCSNIDNLASPGVFDIIVVQANDTFPRNITKTPTVNEMYPSWSNAWSTDSERIVYQRSEGSSQPEIYAISPTGANAMNLTKHPFSDSYPSWSPSGPAPEVTLTVESKRLDIADTTVGGTVAIRADNATGIAGFEFDLRFDSGVIRTTKTNITRGALINPRTDLASPDVKTDDIYVAGYVQRIRYVGVSGATVPSGTILNADTHSGC